MRHPGSPDSPVALPGSDPQRSSLTSASLRAWLACCAAFVLAAGVRAQDAPPPPPDQSEAQAELPAPPHKQTEAQPLVIAIQVEGARRYTNQQLIDALGQKIGSPLDEEQISRGLDTLFRVFKVNASVQRRSAAGGIELRLRVDELRVDLEPRFIGNEEVKTETLRKWALLDEKGELYLYQAPRVRERLLEGYRRDGYYFADVQEVVRGAEEAPGEAQVLPDVIFEIREGPQVRVQDVIVHGNDSMPEHGFGFWKDGLKKFARLKLEGPWIFNWWGAKFVADELEADLVAMRNVYRDRGWLDAVVELQRLEFSPDRGKVWVHVIVDEGQRYTVSKLSITGIKREQNQKKEPLETPVELVFPADELLALCKMKAGTLYERTRQQQDAIALRTYYGERGYLSHPTLRGLDSFEFLEPELRFDVERHTVEVTYRVIQGRQRYIREVSFSGAQHTRDRVLRREVRVMPGQRADIKEIQRSLQYITGTRYFSNENNQLEHHDPTFRFIPTDDPDWVDLEYIVEEGQVVNFQIQGGVDSNNGLFGRISLQMRNFDVANPPDSLWHLFGDVYDKEAFHGAGQRLDIDLQPGTVANAYRIRFVEPDIFRRHFDPYSLELELLKRDRDYDYYEEERFDRRIRVGRKFGRELGIFLGYSNQTVDVSDLDPEPEDDFDPEDPPLPLGLIEQEQNGELHLIGMLLDVEYTKVDNFLTPRKGFTATWRNGLYGGFMGGEAQYVRSDFDLNWFFPQGGSDDDVGPSYHLGLGLGVADAFGDSSEVPYTERFFLGGRNLLRGFAYRGVGPNEGGHPIGGATSINATVEYRVPLYTVIQPGTYKRVEMFRLTLFSDAGVLDPDPFQVDFGELRASVGFGLGMTSPFPLNVNFGFPIVSGDDDDEEVFSFSLFNLAF